jgi:hypothetical protein
MSDQATKAESAEASATDIEITPAMIEAGSDILAFYEPETDRLAETVTRIFRGMLEEHLSRRP